MPKLTLVVNWGEKTRRKERNSKTMASLAALREARAALEQCLSALDGVESEIEGEAVKGGEAEEVTMQRKGKRRREEIGFDKEVGVSVFFAHPPFQKKKKNSSAPPSAPRSRTPRPPSSPSRTRPESGKRETKALVPLRGPRGRHASTLARSPPGTRGSRRSSSSDR